MNKILKMIVIGVVLLGSTALWALGGHLEWSAERIVMAAAVLAVMGFAIGL